MTASTARAAILFAIALLPLPLLAHQGVDHVAADEQAALLAQDYAPFEVDPALTQAPPAAQLQTLGSWGSVIPWPHIPVSAANLPDGRVLTWSSNQRDAFPAGPEFTYTAVWDPEDDSFLEIPHESHDMFCGHQVVLEDGRVFVSGGRNHVPTTSVFDAASNTWITLDDMNRGRWYPTSVALSDGGVLTSVGSSGGQYPEIWRWQTGWQLLTGIDLTVPILSYSGHYEQNWWPYVAENPDGKVVHYGPTPVMHTLDTSGTGSITVHGTPSPAWYPKHGASVVYDVGKILLAGGAISGGNTASSDKAMIIDINGVEPAVTDVGAMHHARKFHNAVALPDGRVMMVGGNTSGEKFNDSGTVLSGEIWDPSDESWTETSSMAIPRNYHSIALLLVDGRVLSAGSGLCGGCAANHQDGQVYSPGYLFDANGDPAPRPVITSNPDAINNDDLFMVQADPGLSMFSLIKMSSTTHAVNTDQRFVHVPFTEVTPGWYQLEAHPNESVLTPGYYMLFALNAAGTPSIAEVIQVIAGVRPGNYPPHAEIPSQANLRGDVVAFQVVATDIDQDALLYAATGLPDGLGIDPNSGLISGTVSAAGFFQPQVVVDDSSGGVATVDFNWSVAAPPNVAVGGTASQSSTAGGGVAARAIDGDTNGNFGAGSVTQTQAENEAWWHLDLGELHDLAEIVLHNRTDCCSGQLSNYSVFVSDVPFFSTSLAATRAQAGVSEFAYAASPSPSQVIPVDRTGRFVRVQLGAGDALSLAEVEVLGAPVSYVGGTAYEYYEGSWDLLPDFDALTPVATGSAAGFDISVRQQDNNFGFRFTALVNVPVAGSYTFYTSSDDGSQLFVDGALVVDNDGLHGPVEQEGTISLAAGFHEVVVTMFEKGGGEVLDVSWQGPGFGQQPVSPASIFHDDPAQISGLAYEYFEGTWTVLPDFDALTPDASGTIGTFSLAPAQSADEFGFRYRGRIAVETAGSYTFTTVSDDGSQLYVDGALVVENDGLHAAASVSGSVSLGVGLHDLEVLFFEAFGGASLQVLWDGPGFAEQEMPASALYPPNRPPVVSPVAAQTHPLGTAIDLQVTATDPDGDAISWSAVGLPPDLTIDPGTGRITGTLVSVGGHASTVTAADGVSGSSAIAIPWTVDDAMGDPLAVDPIVATPVLAGASIDYLVQVSGGLVPQASWNFGDGTPATGYGPLAVSHTFASPGRYLVTVDVDELGGDSESVKFIQAVHQPLSAGRPSASSSVIYEENVSGNDRVWNVNPDHDSVSVFDTVTDARIAEIPVGGTPRSLARAGDGRIWVVNERDASLSVIDPAALAVVDTHTLPTASQPFGIVFDPAGTNAWVALYASGELVRVDDTGALLDQVDVGPKVKHLSIEADGGRVLVSRFVSPPVPDEHTATPLTEEPIGTFHGGEVVVVDTGTLATQTIVLRNNPGPDAENAGRGIPNYLGPAVISPDGTSAWVPSKQDNIERGAFRDGLDLDHDNTVRSVASKIDLISMDEDLLARVDHDDAGPARAGVFDGFGNYLYVALEASREVSMLDVFGREEVVRILAGRAPQGVALAPDGLTLYVHNFMDRSVTVHDLTGVVHSNGAVVPTVATWNAVSTEALAPDVLLGKQLFYDSRDPRLASQQYISCASCHSAGGEDGRVWDLTGFGEGLRNTIDLRGRAGMGHGPLHWSANFDEVQDFEGQIRNLSHGVGLMQQADFDATSDPLGAPKAGLSAELDALAAYVGSLADSPGSPHRDAEGQLTPDAKLGRRVFGDNGCGHCHSGDPFTDSETGQLHDVGTLDAASGGRLGGALPGIDTPSLINVWSGAPYLHDGSAPDLESAVLAHDGVAIAEPELGQLVVYLEQIDGHTLPARCSDGIDNDGDGRADYDGGAAGGAPDPHCNVSDKPFEGASCGLGFEIVAIVPLLVALRRRWRTLG